MGTIISDRSVCPGVFACELVADKGYRACDTCGLDGGQIGHPDPPGLPGPMGPNLLAGGLPGRIGQRGDAVGQGPMGPEGYAKFAEYDSLGELSDKSTRWIR